MVDNARQVKRGDGNVEFTAGDVELTADTPVYQGFFTFSKLKYRHRRFDGSWSEEVIREVHEHHDAVGVLLYDPAADAVVLVEQVRAGIVARRDGTTPWVLEVVAGLIDTDETPEQVGRREVWEEAGCHIDEMIPLYSFYPSPGCYTERVHLYCALLDSSAVGGVHGLAEEQEDIRVHVIPFPKAMQLLEEGKLDNGMMVIAMQWLARERASLRARSNG